jgi:AcrR family transcriptional regulator
VPRPRSLSTHRRILDATRELLSERPFADLRIEHVAARAGVGKAAIYRRWPTKEALCDELLAELARPHLAIRDTGDTREELFAAVRNPMHALTDTAFGPVITSLLSQIALNPSLGDPFRATVVQARREETAAVIRRGIARGDLRPDADKGLATELLVGPVYFRLLFGGELDDAFAISVVDAFLMGYAARDAHRPSP